VAADRSGSVVAVRSGPVETDRGPDPTAEPGPAPDPDAGPGSGADPAGHSPRSGPDLATGLGWLLALIGFVVGARQIADNSFLTHLATGRLILDQGAVPTVDPYSFLVAGERWTVQSWLASLVYAVLDVVFGGWSIRVVHGFAGAGIVLGLWRLVAPARQLVTRVALIGVAVLIGAALWTPRPLLFGMVLMVLTLQVVQGMRPRWWLVPVFWLWVSSHGSFVLGIGLVGAVLVGASIDQRRPAVEELTTLAWAAAGCLVAVVNPLGWRLLWFPFHMMGRSDALTGVVEWRSPSFRSLVEWLFLLLLPLVVLVARRGAPWRSLLPSLVFVAAGLLAVRNIGLAAVVVVALVAPILVDAAGSIDGSTPGLAARAASVVAVTGGALSIVVVALGAPVTLEGYPVDEVDWLDDHELVAEPGVRLLHRETVGNYLTLRYGSEARVFMDDRFDFYPQQVIDDHEVLVRGGDLDEIVSRYQFDVALWAADSPLGRWLDASPEWWVVMADDDWLVACRQTSPLFSRCGAG
jgi:hypothetical protein